MLKKLNAAQVQGTVAENALYCFDSKVAQPLLPVKNRLFHPTKAFALLLLLLLGGSIDLKGQNGVNRDVTEYGFEITAPEVILNAGETAMITIEVGTPSTPVYDAMEFSIDLDLGDQAVLPQSNDLYDDLSWFFTSSPANLQLTTDEANHSVTVTGDNSPYESGYGVLFQIEVEATTDGTNASDLIQDGGGMILVDEIGFKTRPVNPVFDTDAEPSLSASLSDGEIADKIMDARKLTDGIYNVVVLFADGIQKVKKILKQ